MERQEQEHDGYNDEHKFGTTCPDPSSSRDLFLLGRVHFDRSERRTYSPWDTHISWGEISWAWDRRGWWRVICMRKEIKPTKSTSNNGFNQLLGQYNVFFFISLNHIYHNWFLTFLYISKCKFQNHMWIYFY